jgi:hypothetical protein
MSQGPGCVFDAPYKLWNSVGGAGGRNYDGRTNVDLERKLHKHSKRPPEYSRCEAAPQTARALLETNQALARDKHKRQEEEKQLSQVFVDRLLADDRLSVENDKARDLTRRQIQRELTLGYKAAIAEKEDNRAAAYQAKVNENEHSEYFPYVEGESIRRARAQQTDALRGEMQAFLKSQKEQRPPRMDRLIVDTGSQYTHRYPSMPPEIGTRGSALQPELAADPREAYRDDALVAPHIGERSSKFHSRAVAHMSRRICDDHVKKALEDKVSMTQRELEAAQRKQQIEAREFKEGLEASDVRRFDTARSKARERQLHAEFLQSQIMDRQRHHEAERKERREAPAGYWGPEEKDVGGAQVHIAMTSDIIKQMEVNQNRRLESRGRRLRQEQKIIDNCMAEIAMDRAKDHEKQMKHRHVLTSTWQSQQQIKQAKVGIEAL